MVDCREQIVRELSAICDNVKMSTPGANTKNKFPMIVYSMKSSIYVNLIRDNIPCDIEAYANTFEDLMTLVGTIDEVMHDKLGFRLTDETPDKTSRRGTDFYCKGLKYIGNYDKRYGAIVRDN